MQLNNKKAKVEREISLKELHDILLEDEKDNSVAKFIENELSNLLDKIKLEEETITKTRQDRGADEYVRSLLTNDKEENIKNLAVKGVIRGDMILEKLRNALAARVTLTKHQRAFLEIFIQANLQNIYKNDFAANELRIKIQNNIDDIFLLALICCPRRWGKTFVTAWFVACALVCLEDIVVTVFSPAQRQSQLFVDKVREGLHLLQDNGFVYSYYPGEDNKQRIGIVTSTGAHNVLHALPANENTTRGISAQIIVCEEAAAMPMHFFGTIVVPLLQVKSTSLLAITTVQNSENYVSKLLDMRTHDGRASLFNTYKFFTSCDKCREEGKTSTCRHLENDKPDWISASRVTTARAILNQLDMKEEEAAELSGIVRGAHRQAFDMRYIRRLFADTPPLNPVNLTRDPKMVFVSIDPTGGGASDVALLSGIFDRGTFCFTGAESISAQHATQCCPQIIEHLRRLRKIPRFQRSYIVLFIENNMMWCATDIIANILAARLEGLVIPDKTGTNVASTFLVGTEKKHDVGSATTQEKKQSMYVLFREYLKSDSLALIENFVTIHNPYPDDMTVSAEQAVLRMLRDQLQNYYIQVTEPSDPAQQVAKVAFSGKLKGGKVKDDLATVAQLLLYDSREYIAKTTMMTADPRL